MSAASFLNVSNVGLSVFFIPQTTVNFLFYIKKKTKKINLTLLSNSVVLVYLFDLSRKSTSNTLFLATSEINFKDFTKIWTIIRIKDI